MKYNCSFVQFLMKHLHVLMPWPDDMNVLRIKISDRVLFFFCELFSVYLSPPPPPPSGLSCWPFEGGGSVVVDSLLIVTPIGGFYNCFMFCCALLCVHSSYAIISMGKRELVALLFAFLVSRDCCVALPHSATGLSAVCNCGIS